ncbi:aflatoxin B1 aldehyde reductase [Skeletonema marinoi]|uniref:Aflatoxin B1 aldehyde reductase n=1 Tax=Skeletonema marinoi TaxID=267567 RepID=A0AAD8YLG3_9STRA|nr:aflatoxin B1 aldehyde reductase [Skeletonema marinoi]
MLIRLPSVYLGTMTFGWRGQTSAFVDTPIAAKMIENFVSSHKDDAAVHIDCARIYAGGDSEKILRDAMASYVDKSPALLVGTKAHPSQPDGLSEKGLMQQLQKSFDALGVASVDEYYLHQPDENNSLLESLQTCDKLIKQGKISAIGMSNYHASEVQRAFDLCTEHSLAKPSVYQGLYNPLNRCVETDLLPVLRKNGCKFIAYNPLAAGLLTGKHLSGTDVKEGRFKNNPNYLPRFYTPVHFEALTLIQEACKDSNLSMVEATYLWLMRHSALDSSNGDGVLLGASSIEQLEQNLKSCALASDPSFHSHWLMSLIKRGN